MNIKLVLKLVGRVLLIEAAALTLPLAVALMYRESPAPFLLSIAIVALCHDLCKVGCYKKGFRNVKDDATGKWEKVPTFYYEDKLPYGHGEKSVYIISGFMRLTREEAMAIRWHMGFSGTEDNRVVGQALQQYPLAFALATADMEASYFLEKA